MSASGFIRSIDVPREDKPARYRQYARNYQFFGAPVALFFAREKAHGPAQWADIGGYLQTVCLLARGYGLHTCPQQAWVSFHRTVREFLELPAHLMIYSGMALGFADESRPDQRLALPARAARRFCVVFRLRKLTAPSAVQPAFTGARSKSLHAGLPILLYRSSASALLAPRRSSSRRSASSRLPEQGRAARLPSPRTRRYRSPR